jgi:hypothetical protein
MAEDVCDVKLADGSVCGAHIQAASASSISAAVTCMRVLSLSA